MMLWLRVGAVSWLALLACLVWLLLAPAPAAPGVDAPVLQPERIQVLTCTTRVATVDSSGETHIKTIDCKEDKQ